MRCEHFLMLKQNPGAGGLGAGGPGVQSFRSVRLIGVWVQGQVFKDQLGLVGKKLANVGLAQIGQ